MSSNLPSSSNLDSNVKTFGLGTYDSDEDDDLPDQNTGKGKDSLPSGGAADIDVTEHITSYLENTASSDLPCDKNVPVGRSDYYDRSSITSRKRKPDSNTSQLPGALKNETSGPTSLGNDWIGRVEEDASDVGFPGQVPSLASRNGHLIGKKDETMLRNKTSSRSHSATNIALVGELTEKLLKEHGKKDLTRRHVMSFLQATGSPQFLASDLIRCLKYRHSIHVKDVLDEFPVSKQAAKVVVSEDQGLEVVRERLINLEIASGRDVKTAHSFRVLAARVTDTLALLERLKVHNG